MSTQALPTDVFRSGNFRVNTRKIISVWPEEMIWRKIRGAPVGKVGATTAFVLPAAPKDGYSEIEVEDLWEWINNWRDDGHHELGPAPKSADIVARSLVDAWTSNTIGAGTGGRPGIAVRNEDIPLEQQLADLRRVQNLFFTALVDEAQQAFNSHEYKKITSLHRLAARSLNLKVAWIADLSAENLPLKKCPACGRDILAEALKCENCQTMLPDFYETNAVEVDPKVDPVVAGFIETRRARRAELKAQGQFKPKA
jgi:hypothetical protein